MSADRGDQDDTNLPFEDELASTGAAADSAEPDDRLKALPRLLRYVVLGNREKSFAEERLIAEIVELAPDIPLASAWIGDGEARLGLALASELDHRAVATDRPDLRSLADCLRLMCLTRPKPNESLVEYRRVAKSLLLANKMMPASTDPKLAAEIEAFCFGWAAISNASTLLPKIGTTGAAADARLLGRLMARRRVEAARFELQATFDEQMEAREPKSAAAVSAAIKQIAGNSPAQVTVCTMDQEAMKNSRMHETIKRFNSVINTLLPLVPVPPLVDVRNQLRLEFPYAFDVVDFALADLVGRTTVRLRPILLVGPPGGGKTRFSRRLGELLGISVWRCDANQSDGATFGGTERRWNSAEPCHAFLAIARAGHGNPMVLLDEIEKAATRTDYGRLWDSLLSFLEPESSARYPDPTLQTPLNLSHVSFVATANSLGHMPAPLCDRFRIVDFPQPRPEDLDALLPAVIADLAAERGLDLRWIEPLSGVERDAVARNWRGASVRRLRRVVDVVLRVRETLAVRN